MSEVMEAVKLEIVPEVLSFKRSDTIGALVAALCKAQLAFDPIKKESENPAFKRGNRVSKYADMFSLVTATRKHLNANGLTIMQFPSVTGKTLIVATLLAHESGEWVSNELLIPAVDERGFTAHSIGKAMTYARRFSWGPIIGAVAEDDDDGNDISGQGTMAAAQAVGAAKVETYKAKKAQEGPEVLPVLNFRILPDDVFAVYGDSPTMEAHKELLLLHGKRVGNVVHMEANKFEDFKFIFSEERKGIIRKGV